MKTPARLVCIALAGLLGLSTAAAQDVAETYAFLATVAVKGQSCGLLERWESETVLAESDRLLDRVPPAEHGPILLAAEDRIAATQCDDAAMRDWIDAARPGIETEWLPPYLALFKALAGLESPPAAFADAAAGIDADAAIAAIEDRFAAFAAADIAPEGGGNWDAFQAAMEDVARSIAAAVSGGNDEFTAAEAQLYVVESAAITALWLESQEVDQ